MIEFSDHDLSPVTYPMSPREWLILDSVDSTQLEAARRLRSGHPEPVILAREQTRGKGRFDRAWHSPKDESLSLTLTLADHGHHPKPWLLGMALAVAAAEALDCRLRWPNDLFLEGKKVGGILTEIIEGVPVIGIGVNLNQTAFPAEIEDRATSLAAVRGGAYDPIVTASRIIELLPPEPWPTDWPALSGRWLSRDDTPGKLYRLPKGQEALAVAIGSDGELICQVDGEQTLVYAADAVFGP